MRQREASEREAPAPGDGLGGGGAAGLSQPGVGPAPQSGAAVGVAEDAGSGSDASGGNASGGPSSGGGGGGGVPGGRAAVGGVQPAKPMGKVRAFVEWVKPLVIVLAVVLTMRSALADWHDVPSGSMNPTIVEGDRIVVNKLAYDLRFPFTDWVLWEWDAPERGDIITFWSPKDGTRMVKRVVAVGGDTVEVRAGKLLINGQPARYTPLPQVLAAGMPVLPVEEAIDRDTRVVQYLPRRPRNRDYGPLAIPPDHIFAMGDNRDNSADSRVYGPVSMDAVTGRAFAVAFSFQPGRFLTPRWSRTFVWLE